ncbi:hypothetical protein HK405_012563, partial [Cladochytrium tenue]
MKVRGQVVRTVPATTAVVGAAQQRDPDLPPFIGEALRKFRKHSSAPPPPQEQQTSSAAVLPEPSSSSSVSSVTSATATTAAAMTATTTVATATTTTAASVTAAPGGGGDVALLTVHRGPEEGTSYELHALRWTEVAELGGATPADPAAKRVERDGAGWAHPNDGAVVSLTARGRAFAAASAAEAAAAVAAAAAGASAADAMASAAAAVAAAAGDYGGDGDVEVLLSARPAAREVLDLAEADVAVGANELPEAVEAALLTMRAGEAARVVAAAGWGWGRERSTELGLLLPPPDGDAGANGVGDGQQQQQQQQRWWWWYEFRVELHAFAAAKEPRDMTLVEKFAAAARLREAGNAYFRDGKLRPAVWKYEEVIRYFEYERNLTADERAAADAAVLASRLNLAACRLKSGEFARAEKEATLALTQSPQSAKALYRRAQARLGLGDAREAALDAERAAELLMADGDQAGAAAPRQLARRARAEERRADDAAKRVFRN